jgi:hypothetical protein
MAFRFAFAADITDIAQEFGLGVAGHTLFDSLAP